MLVGHHGENELLEVSAVIFVVTVCDLDGSEVVILGKMGPKRELLHDLKNDLVEQVGTPVLVGLIKGA